MSTSDCVRLWKIAGMNRSTTQNSACEEDASKKSVRPNAEWGWCGKLCSSSPVRWKLRNGNNVERFHEILNVARGIIENIRLWLFIFKDEMDGWSTRCFPKTWKKKCWLRKQNIVMEKLTSPNCKLLNTEEAKTHVTHWKGLMGDTRVPWKKQKMVKDGKGFEVRTRSDCLRQGKVCNDWTLSLTVDDEWSDPSACQTTDNRHRKYEQDDDREISHPKTMSGAKKSETFVCSSSTRNLRVWLEKGLEHAARH